MAFDPTKSRDNTLSRRPWRGSRRGVLAALGGATAGLWLAACAPGGQHQASMSGASSGATAKPAAGSSPAAAAATSAPKKGGQAVVSISHPTTLNPAISPVSTTIYNTPFFYNALTKPADDYQPQPDLAASWKISSDSLSYTFKLRDGVKFHDGKPFSADDVKFTWELICHPDNKSGRQIAGFFDRITGAKDYIAGKAKEIAGIKILDPLTIQVTLDEIYAPFLTVSAGQMIMPKHVWKDVPVKNLEANPASRKPIGTGPFVLDSWTTNESIVAHAYPDYHEGRAKLDKIISLDVADQTTGFNLLKAGQVNAMGLYSSMPIDNYAEAKADPKLEARPLTGFQNQYTEFNFRNPLFQDLRVRTAISYATDRKAILAGLWKGMGLDVNSPIHPVFWCCKKDTTTYDNDLDQAKKLLAEAGWTMGSNGILEKGGKPFSFSMPTLQGSDYAVVLQQQWKRVGIDVQVEQMDFGSFWAPRYLSGKFDMVAMNLPFGLYLDPDYPLSGYFSSKLDRNKYSNPKIDQLIRQGTATLDRDARKKTYFDFQETLAHDVPHLWLGVPAEIWGITKGLVIPNKPTGYLTIRSAKDWYWES